MGILTSVTVMLGSGVGLSLTSAGAGNDDPVPQVPEVVSALGTAAASPSASPTPSSSPTPEPSPAPEPPPPPPPAPEPEPAPVDELLALEDEVTALTNAERAAAGCGDVATDERLRTAARGHSEDMAVNDYFSHTGLDGRSPFDRMSDAGYPDPAGENIAYGYRTPADVMEGWMNSTGHRENLLTCGHQTIGVGIAYDGDGRPYWTQVFGR